MHPDRESFINYHQNKKYAAKIKSTKHYITNHPNNGGMKHKLGIGFITRKT